MLLDLLPPMPWDPDENLESAEHIEVPETPEIPEQIETQQHIYWTDIQQCWPVSCETAFILEVAANTFIIWILSIIILTGLIYLITRKKTKEWTFKQAMKKIWKYYIIMWIILVVLTCVTIKTMFRLSGY